MSTGTNGGGTGDALLEEVLNGRRSTFAVLHRPESGAGPDAVEVLAGPASTAESLADLPLDTAPAADPGTGAAPGRHELLTLVPYRQIRERGFDCADDGAPLITLRVEDQGRVPLAGFRARVPDTGITLSDGGFDVEDAAYAATARRIIDGEIGNGEGANFVLRRSFTATVEGFSAASALTLFRRLLSQESGAYWTFVVHTPHGTFVGASPERHVSLDRGTAVMNPISGTYRYPASGPALEGVKAFLADRKEADELYMVVDEELKMMARICDSVPRVVGPRLKEMARLAHTEYHNEQVSGFWLGRSERAAVPELAGLDVLVVDAEDTFTAMLAHQLRALGPRVEVRRYDEPFRLDGRGLVVMGPGPGDPRDTAHPKIAVVRRAVRDLLAARAPFLAVCLSHQALCLELGLEVVRRDTPNQGAQHTVDLFGRSERVGFYNTFAGRCAEPVFVPGGGLPGPVEAARDPRTGEVHALRGPGFASMQFHPESLLTRDGVGILARTLSGVLQPGAVPA